MVILLLTRGDLEGVLNPKTLWTSNVGVPKDYSDEYNCKCPDYIDEQKVCDSHVDCYDWGDEGKKCDYCKDYAYQGKTWYCHLSKQCIRKDQVI